MGKMKYGYHTIGLPEDLTEKILEVIASGEYGYTDIPDFTIDAVRKYLRELEYLK